MQINYNIIDDDWYNINYTTTNGSIVNRKLIRPALIDPATRSKTPFTLDQIITLGNTNFVGKSLIDMDFIETEIVHMLIPDDATKFNVTFKKYIKIESHVLPRHVDSNGLPASLQELQELYCTPAIIRAAAIPPLVTIRPLTSPLPTTTL